MTNSLLDCIYTPLSDANIYLFLFLLSNRLDAALLRQITYGTTRLGLFRLLTDEYVDRYDRNK